MKLPALVLGIGAGLAAMLALASPVESALGRLTAARTERAALTAPPPATAAIAPGLAIEGRNAAASLDRHIRAQAARDGVLVERAQTTAAGGLVRVTLGVSGSPDAVLHFVDALERGRPLVRFARWRVAASGKAVRLDAEAVAPWR